MVQGRRWRRFGWLVVALGVAAGCTRWERVSHEFPGGVGAAVDHERWTRSQRLYQSLSTVALFNVTLLSPALQEQLDGLVAAEVPGRMPADVLGISLPQAQARIVIIVSARSTEWARLDPPVSPWSLMLDTGSQTLPPSEIKEFTPPAAFERYFPAWNPWSKAWVVGFPTAASALSGEVGLKLSAPGDIRTTLRWP